jgi:hypothetical protein
MTHRPADSFQGGGYFFTHGYVMSRAQNRAVPLALGRWSPWGDGSTGGQAMPQRCRGISRTSGRTSSRISKGVFAAIALSLTFGAAQFASGRDLQSPDHSQDFAGQDFAGQDFAGDAQDRLQSAFQDPLLDPSQDPAQQSPSMGDIAINRAAKSDRAAGVVGAAAPTRTISLRPQGVSDSSILIRIPMAQARNGSSAPALTRSGDRKMTVACEAVVSVLTEVARLLQPGRCVT